MSQKPDGSKEKAPAVKKTEAAGKGPDPKATATPRTERKALTSDQPNIVNK